MKKIVVIVSLLSTLFANQAFATTCKAAVSLLTEGTAAPCSGWLFDEDTAKEASNLKLQYPILQEEFNTVKEQVTELKGELADEKAISEDQKQKAKLWQDRAVDITEKYVAVENSRGTRDALFYGAGIVTMLLLIFAESQAQQRR